MEQLGFMFVLGPSWQNYWYPEDALSTESLGTYKVKNKNNKM